MIIELSNKQINDLLTLLKRVNVTGEEAPVLVHLTIALTTPYQQKEEIKAVEIKNEDATQPAQSSNN